MKPSHTQLYCSPFCASSVRRRLKPWCPLQARCLRWITAERASATELARRVGLDQSRIQYWFRNDGSTLPTAMLLGIADLLGITLQQAIAEAGGGTAEQEK